VKHQIVIATILTILLLPTNPIYATTEDLFTVNVNTFDLIDTRFIPQEIKNFTADESGIYIPNIDTIDKFDHQMNKVWTYSIPATEGNKGFSSPLIIEGDEIYIVGSPSDIYKINKTTGEQIDHLTIPYFTPDSWYTRPPIVLGEKIITWGNGQICILQKTPLTKINCKTVTPFMALDYKYIVLESGALVGKTSGPTVNSYGIEGLEQDGPSNYKNWQSIKTAENERSNTNLAEQTDKNGNIYYLSGGGYGPTEPNTVYLIKLDAGNGDTVNKKEIKAYGTNALAYETLLIDKINNIAYILINDKNTDQNKNTPTIETEKEYKRLYAIDLDKTEDYIKYTYPFQPNSNTNKNIILHNSKVYISSGKQIHIFDDKGFYTKLSIGYNLMGTPQITKNEKQEYILYSHTTKIAEEYNTHRFIGIKVEDLKYCPTGLYCENTPKHRPVILIHGFGGNPESWEAEGEKKEYKKRILELYRQDDNEFPEEWLVSYSYGIDAQGKYDYQGRIENISAGLNQLVPFLADEHKFYGGDGKVDIVAYSLGGIVARNYLNNNSENHHVRKLITIASPHKGVDWLNYDFNLRTCALVQCFGPTNVVKTAVEQFVNKHRNTDFPISYTSDSVNQITPNGNQSVLNKINSKYIDIDATALYGDIYLKSSYNLFGIEISKKISIGDGLVLTPSASNIANVSKFKSYAYSDEIKINPKVVTGYDGYVFEIPDIAEGKYFHTKLPLQKEVIDDVINILINEK